MNHTTAEFRPSLFAIQKIDQKSQNQKSLLSRIFSGCIKAMKSIRNDNRSVYRHKSFIEENLLDENLGHEISRTLRR
jgi:hypothetical protein